MIIMPGEFEIKEWEEVKEDLNFDSIILGNGASISISNKFNYHSLYEEAFNEQDSRITEIFDEYETTDFELILDRLFHADKVNEIFNIDDPDSELANNYDLIKDRLIEVIRENYIEYQELSNELEKIYKFLKKFDKVFSLNYDLTVYWSMLEGDEVFGTYFKDCFINGSFDSSDWKKYAESYTGASGSTLVFYPHGNLVLARNANDDEIKLNRGDGLWNLLERIFMKWEDDNYRPLFISEGSSAQKLKSIKRSPYLNIVYYNIIPSITNDICIYGWSLADNDNHLVKKFFKDNYIYNVAVSIFKGDRNNRALQNEMRSIKTKIKNYSRNSGINILFYDSSSEGCWIY
jgi:CRISPR/Cas system-associated endoribonuclease Cas2